MKKLIQFLLLCLLLVFNACSTFVERVPAQVDNEIFNSAFSIPYIDKETGADNMKLLESIGTQHDDSIIVEVVKVNSLTNKAAFKLELDVDDKTSKLVYRVYHAPKALNDINATYAVMDLMTGLIDNRKLGSPYMAFEIYHNAKSGDPVALDNILKIRTQQNYKYGDATEVYETEGYKSSIEDVEKLREELKAPIKELKAKRSVDREKRKSILSELDKAPEGKQFRMLIAKNDRKGAMAVLKKYLPWEAMAPFEKKFWEIYIEVTLNPVPLDQRVMIYRGLEEDYVHRVVVGTKELTEKEAILQSKAFVMSSGMVKNQGSWNRRLRSLEAMNSKFIAEIKFSDEYAQSARITTMFFNHSRTPHGSPFLSFSPRLSVAENFGGTRVSAYLMDPRLLSFNYASLLEHEVEYLVPLTTFPDEMIGIADSELIPGVDNGKYLDEKLEKIIAKEFGEDKKNEIITKIKKNSHSFFSDNYKEIVDVKGLNPGPSNLTFYKKFIAEGNPKVGLTPQGELDCKNLIQLFWVAN